MDKRKLELKKLCEKYEATFKKGRRGGHYHVVCNGKTTFVSATASDSNFLKQVERNLQQMKGLR